ncbi:heparan-alpha-glucosaminide N-acetyltransferase-like isoform X2 [Mytilus californianus]|uniref:heparan-alpha-glucosaminide N-acetyltransferase-like isoform X2 n=1 Tax=Mytilus californianus TaxID=6549 RepID=UPI0022461522|nr:heparan-alpha-glucosaminide N-acetyltransferase-like isoform X2 [Mytilus californianus]
MAACSFKNLTGRILSIYVILSFPLLVSSVMQSNCKPDNKMDNARVTIINNTTKPGVSSLDLLVSSITAECYTCDLQPTIVVNYSSSCTILLDSRWSMKVAITGLNPAYKTTNSCGEFNLSTHFKEYGEYNIYVELMKDKIKCKGPILMNAPADSNIPIYIMLGGFVFAAAMFVLGIKFYRGHLCSKLLMQSGNEHLIDPSSYASQDLGSSPDLGTMQTNINPTGTPENKKPKKERLKSLDTFRGISIVIMIFCNYGGGKYWFIKHSKWNGLTVADLVFPWFVFIMGTSMAYSYTSLLRSNTPKYKMFFKIFKRSCILFLLGLVINSEGCNAVELTKFRMPGVLQRFAGTYLITATLHMFFAKLEDGPNTPTRTNPVRDITDYPLEWIINFIFIGIYCVLMFGLDVPGCPKGYLGPGGLSENSSYFNCTGGAAGYIDREIFGLDHIYKNPTSKEIYKNTIAYDPEGLLGTLTSCVICFLGLQAGKIFMTYKNRQQRVKRLLIWGFALCLIAGILCKFSKNEGWIPVNKNLWSVSFVFCTGGFAFILLTFCYLMIDEWKLWNGAPFYYPGMNSILLYMGHELFHHNFPISWRVPQHHGSLLALDVYGTAIWLIVALYCFHKNLFFVI